ncbi:MAG: type II secretion system F family protein [Bradymonadaceae bacterium]|nr:type II secretion system F family protein [Lujinxingiaceae bacterium]
MADPTDYGYEGRAPVVREQSSYMTDTEAERLCALFADGLSSGVGYARILSMLERQGGDKKLLDRLRVALLEHGDMLGEAFARYGILEPSARKLILVAEQQGKLPDTFRQLAKIYGKRHDRKKKFLYAMIEPMILVILGMIVARNLFSTDLTEITFGKDTTGALTAIFIRSAIEGLIFGLGCVAVAMASLNMPVDFALRSMAHRMLLRTPILGMAGNLYAISLFCMYIRQSITSGMTVFKSLELAAEASNAPSIWGNIHRAQDQIAEGATLAQALYTIKSLPVDVVENIDIGEESGRLEERLEWLSERYEVLSTENFQRLMASMLYMSRFVIIIVVIVSLLLMITKMELFPSDM